jgi:hypothetical protein
VLCFTLPSQHIHHCVEEPFAEHGGSTGQ